MRKITQISSQTWQIYALCDDGTVWRLPMGDGSTEAWTKLSDIPQDEHEEAEPAHPSKWRPAGSLPIFYIPHDGLYAEKCESAEFFVLCKGILPSITMIQAENKNDALRIWLGMRDKSVKTRIEKLKIGDAEYDYIVECVTF